MDFPITPSTVQAPSSLAKCYMHTWISQPKDSVLLHDCLNYCKLSV